MGRNYHCYQFIQKLKNHYMQKGFDRILLPVDFSVNTEIAVKRAIELVEEKGSFIHLVHVFNPVRIFLGSISNIGFAGTPEKNTLFKERQKKLEQWKMSIQNTLESSIVSSEIVIDANIEYGIIKSAEDFKPNLTILGKHSFYSFFRLKKKVSSSLLADTIGCPVLTLKPGVLTSKMTTVVIPVGSFVPDEKILAIGGLSRRLHFKVYLISISNRSAGLGSESSGVMMKTFRLLKNSLHSHIECRVIEETNLGRAALRFAKSIHADMVLVNPYSETSISAFTDKQLIDSIRPGSGLQVLTIKPYTFNN